MDVTKRRNGKLGNGLINGVNRCIGSIASKCKSVNEGAK